MSRRHVLVVRLDSVGDVLICGPAVRAVARSAERVTMLVSSRGQEAARLLPGVDDVVVWDCPWITATAPSVDRDDVEALIERLRDLAVDSALILTSFHQSALPTALVLRLAGVPRIGAISEDYPGTLLDERIAPPPDAPEPLRMLSVATAAGYPPGPGDGAMLRIRPTPDPPDGTPSEPYVVVHPGADAPARAYPPELWHDVVSGLTERGHTVVITGWLTDAALATQLGTGQPPGRVVNLCGRTTLAQLAAVLDRARVVAVSNTGPAHLAAAVGTPVVSLFAPVVPAARWLPYGVPSIMLGDQHAACAGTRARVCPVPDHPCLSGVTPATVIAAVERLGRPTFRLVRAEVPA